MLVLRERNGKDSSDRLPGFVGCDLELTRPEWQKKRKKMASKMGKSGRVR
jgi:hypothetical protein